LAVILSEVNPLRRANEVEGPLSPSRTSHCQHWQLKTVLLATDYWQLLSTHPL